MFQSHIKRKHLYLRALLIGHCRFLLGDCILKQRLTSVILALPDLIARTELPTLLRAFV